jgi:HK97 family phage prohead protease
VDLKYFTGPITKADAGGLEAVISTPKVDHDGESVDPMGLKNRDEWLTNPLIYWAHEWARNPMAEPIGKGTRLDVHGDRIESAAVYAPTPKAQNIRALVAGGFVRKTSIGFDPLEMADIKGIPTHTAWRLLEWSVVPMPANTEATITGVKSALRWLADEVADPDDTYTTMTAEAIEALVAKTVDARLDLFAVPDGAVALVEQGRRIATIRRRRVAVLP